LHSPYTSNFFDAYTAANTSIGVALSAVLWGQRQRPLPSRVVMQAAVLLAAVAPSLGEFEAGLGVHLQAGAVLGLMKVIAALGTVAVLLAGRLGPLAWAVIGQGVLYFVTGYVKNSDMELFALHMAWLGLLVGLHRAAVVSTERHAAGLLSRSHAGDWVLLALATLCAAFVGHVILDGMVGSADEWAYTYQAAVFAKLRAYAQEPPCTWAYQNFWVFPYMGKQFSQYPPGWAYFMVPFVRLGVPWLAGSFALGLFVVGTARLARRAMSLADDGTASAREVSAAGVSAAVVIIASSTMLINGASRYPHVFVLVNYVWALEALLHLASPGDEPSHPLRWASLLGACAALLLATRPLDGAGLGVGLFAYYVYALVRRRFSAKSVCATAVAFAIVGGLTLIILRLQLGKWFTTGYSLNSIVHPWNKFVFVKPKPSEWRWGFPLATGSYCWWPCSLAIGFAGLASLGRRGRAINTILLLSLLPVLVPYAFLNLGRGYDWGYGPRYQLILVVPMALGTGVAFARLYGTAIRRHAARLSAALSAGAFAVAVMAAAVGVLRIAPLVYPFNYTAVRNENRLQQAIRDAHIHKALVIAMPGTGGVDPGDLTQNLPLDLYPDQDVIIAVAHTPGLERCVFDRHPDRAVYRADGREVRLSRLR